MNLRLLVIVALLVSACAILGLLRLDIDTDVVRSLPGSDRVIRDALDIFQHHPIHDQVAVDLAIDRDDPDLLVECGELLEQEMKQSGLFARVGMAEIGEAIPEIALHVAKNLPLLLTGQELDRLAPRLERKPVEERVRAMVRELSSMDGIGQTVFFRYDPLGFRDLILAKMSALAPGGNTVIYRGHLLSADRKHLLVTGRPLVSGTDSVSAKKIETFLGRMTGVLADRFRDVQITLTPVGTYRAALDNERIIRHDVRLALLLATAGIGLLLLFSFPRPWAGLISLVPALAGTGAALFVYSLIQPSISIMVLGFGGAIISITVDHGIAYMLFLDRPGPTDSRGASHEVRTIGIMAVITTIGAFLILGFSGFPVFTELGRFTALGILFSFLFVHFILPQLVPTLPPAPARNLPLHRLVDLLYATGRYGALFAALLALCLLFLARPQFHVSLDSMNTVSRQTRQADSAFTRVWGDFQQQVFLMNKADSPGKLQRIDDRILKMVEEDIQNGVLKGGFVPSMLFPGPERARENLADWREFWTETRREQLTGYLTEAGKQYGFTPRAFGDFLAMLDPEWTADLSTPDRKYFSLLGIGREEGQLIRFITLVPGPQYRPEEFFNRYREKGKLFDGSYFSTRLASILFSTFTGMLLIIAVSLALLLLFFYLNVTLTLLTLTPVVFAYICTLGTLKLIGHPLDIPALMLSIIILGMGIDYSIFCVRAHQRYRDVNHPCYALVRVSVFLAGMSTLIGFGVLCFADHSLLRSIGVTSFTGIGFSLAGTFLLLPPMLGWYFSERNIGKIDATIEKRVRYRFRLLEPYPRMFARFKLRLDPLFADLPDILAHGKREQVQTIVDVGCGYGVPACWCLETFPDSRIYGIDPDAERIRVASLAAGKRGEFTRGLAPELPDVPGPADLILVLDMLHYLDDDAVKILFERAVHLLGEGGLLAARYVIRPQEKTSFFWKVEDLRVRRSGRPARYRRPEETAGIMEQAGFTVVVNTITTTNPELVWLAGRIHG